MNKYSGDIPNGASVEANIKEMHEYFINHTYEQTLYYFYLKVRAGGEWDYKHQDREAMANGTKSKYEDFGNYNYGAVGRAIGLPTSILLSSAGGAQISSKNGSFFLLNAIKDYLESLAHSDSSRNFGINDDPNDRANILNGIDDYDNIYGKKYDYFDDTIDFWKNFADDAKKFIANLPNNLNDKFKDLVSNLNNFLDLIAPQWTKDFIADLYDPLVLDLNGDGKISLSENNVYFDHNGDDIAFLSSWISSNDGLLAFDKNANGLIDNGNELFGNFTLNSNGAFANNGFEALANLDSNNDGIISNLDDKFNDLKIWQDLNSNGISELNELKNLSEFDITNINLNTTSSNINLGNGNTQILQSTFIKTNDTNGLAVDINFNVDTIQREFKDEINLTQEQLKRPNVKATGFLRDLRVASALNENLANLLDSYLVATTKSSQLNLLDDVITQWAKTNPNFSLNFTLLKADEANNANARTIRLTPTKYSAYKNFIITDEMQNKFNNIKEKIAIINSFTGRTNTEFFITSQSDLENIINQTNKTYNAIKTYTYKSLLTQTRLKEYLNLITLDINETTDTNGNTNFKFSLNYDEVIAKFKEVNSQNPQKAFVDLAEFIDLYKDKSKISNLMLTLSNFATTAKDNGKINDYLKLLSDETIKSLSSQNGLDYNEILIGTGILNGIDTLYGNGGNDTLIGGSGNDTLSGGSGDDVYEFNGDFGNDTIYNHDISKNRFDIIKFTDNTTKDDLNFQRENNNLIIKKLNSQNSITIQDFFKDSINLSYTINAIEFASGKKLTRDQIVDIILAPTNGNDSLEMFFANKDYIINALGGDDIITTKNGNDTIRGGDGDDTMRSGDGDDTIYGNSGNDDIYAGDGNDTIDGGSGNDILQGGEGDDVYIFKDKFGSDTILNYKPLGDSEIDAIKFANLKSNELSFIREFKDDDITNNLIINTKDGSVKILDIFKDGSKINSSYKIDAIYTKDNKKLDIDDIKRLTTLQTNKKDIIQAYDDINHISSGDGDDILKASSKGSTLDANKGNDILISNSGNDTLYGGLGSDIYIYNGGKDTIKDTGGKNDALIIKGYLKDEATLTKNRNDLIISFKGNKNNQITIKDHYKWVFGKHNQIESIIFDKHNTLSLKDTTNYINNRLSQAELSNIINELNITTSKSNILPLHSPRPNNDLANIVLGMGGV